MNPSKVYYTDLHVHGNTNLLRKLEKLIRAAGIENIDFANRFTALKLHFGEEGNLAYLRPNYVKVVADVVKSLGGVPFLTDCNTLYVGSRKNAIDHLDVAALHGFGPLTTGCQVIIADGLKGTDEILVPVPCGEYVQEAKIGHAIMDADIIISVNHFKGHEQAGFGGALKNLGMGCGSRAGKMEQHASGKPHVLEKLCTGCRACVRQCAHDAITYGRNGKAAIDHGKCVGCGRCLGACNFDAINPPSDHSCDILCKKMAEYAWAVLEGRPHFHISLVIDVSPFCDCHGENDIPLIPDVGFFASFDPVALDQACADACNRMPPMPGSMIQDSSPKEDRFTSAFPDTDWQVALAHAEKLGLGTRAYELVTLK